MEDAVINVADTTGKAVVSISIERAAKTKAARRIYMYPYDDSPMGMDDPLRRFFEDFFGEIPQREFKYTGLGSGVIIDREGYILTNQHVVSGADKITVTLPDGREFKGEIKGEDLRSDLAVIKINAHDLPVAMLGDSEALKIGQWVVAIGNPFGFALDNPEPTVTAGVISALHRSLGKTVSRDRDYGDLIQTDAAINPGNSGGPLVNLKGEVVGINVAIFSTSGGYQGIGFAVPINKAKKVISSLIAGKRIVYGWLGIRVQELTDELVKYFGLPDKNGVLVIDTVKDGPGAKAGIKDGDVIRTLDNSPILGVKELLNTVARIEVGRKVEVVLMREKKEVKVLVEIAERPNEIEPDAKQEDAPAVRPGIWRGIQIDDIPTLNQRRLPDTPDAGVVVVAVVPESPADRAGLMEEDIIIEINKQKIRNSGDFSKVVKNLKGNALVRTQRGYLIIKENIEK